MNYRESDLKHLWHPYTDINKFIVKNFPVIEKARGVHLWDTQGRKYMDGISSWWCVNLGHSHPHIVNSVAEQLLRVQHSITGGMSHTSVIELSDMLSQVTPAGLTRAYYASDGASAVEASLRMAIQYWWNLGRSEKKNIISLTNAYHGDTLGTVALGFIPGFHQPIAHALNRSVQAPAPHCFHCPFGESPESCSTRCFAGMEEILRREASRTAAVIAEPVCQGAAGIRIYPPEYIGKLSKLCCELDVLMILDEIAVGFGRTGKMFASDLAGVTPDLLVVGKSLTGGYLPMSAVLATERIYDSFRSTGKKDRTFYHGHTFAGNPLASAAATAALQVFREEEIVERSCVPAKLAGAFRKFRTIPGVHNAASLGSMSSLEISESAGGKRAAALVTEMAISEGLLLRPLGPVIYLWPPLNSSEKETDEMLAIFGDCLQNTLT